jgi:hypothetical protein
LNYSEDGGKTILRKQVKYKNLHGAIPQREWNFIMLFWRKTFEYFSTNKVNINKVDISGIGRFFSESVTAV